MRIVFMSMVSIISILISDCNSSSTNATPCFSDREVTKEISSKELKCITSSGELVLLLDESTQARYSVCNALFQVFGEGESYVVDGKTYKIMPNERWPGEPLEITKVRK